MLKRILTQAISRKPKRRSPNQFRAKKGQQLLSSEDRQRKISHLRLLYSDLATNIWEQDYLYALEQFAELAQEITTKGIDEHTKPPSFIDHTLQMLILNAKDTPRSKEHHSLENSTIASDRRKFGVFTILLASNMQEIISGVEVSFQKKTGRFQQWHPWHGAMPLGTLYTFQHKQHLSNHKTPELLNQAAIIPILPYLIRGNSTVWLFEDHALLNQLFDCLKQKANPKDYSNPTMLLHEEVMDSLRELIHKNALITNRPGADIWVTEEETWVLSKTAIETARTQLAIEGLQCAPINVAKIFKSLRANHLIIENPEGGSVWTAKVTHHATKWQQKQTFLRIKNDIIDPPISENIFDGNIVPIDRSGNPITTCIRHEHLI
ncbi:hypothetical protein A9Q99_27370 [Gammaproteobacteria bacterium 45_16_T64]|nr:hypothetical protein A9Q99_27370 [Gammaproteobacteria bacterium 45_16_T64]